jgi:hypothetical protein
MGENLSIRLERAAHHEAGHVVVAAARKLRLRSEGVIVDADGEGLACFCKRPDNTDISRESCILASLSGFFAERRFCDLKGYACPSPHDLAVILGPDWKEAREIQGKLTNGYLRGRGSGDVLKALEDDSEKIVLRYWTEIEAVAHAILAKSFEPLQPLKSGAHWSNRLEARCVPGVELVKILEGLGISALCVDEC